MKFISFFTSRGRGRIFSKRRIIKSILNSDNNKKYSDSSNEFSNANGCLTSFFMIIGKIVIWSIKIILLPITLIYYGFIKKRVKTNTKTFLKITAFIIWSYWFYFVFEANYIGIDDVKFDDYNYNLLFFLVPEIFMIINMYNYFKSGNYKKKNPLLENDQIEADFKSTEIKRSRQISQSVKDKVWNRDEGKCVQCGSNEDLEFDHIIPFSKGGANTYRNIQLLCEPCNRSKSAKIG